MKMTKRILAIVLAIAMVACFAACGKKDGNVLKVATNAEFEPFESLDKDGNIVGFDVDLFDAIGEKIGYEIEYDNMEFDGVIAAVTQGSCDAAISGLTINAKRSKSVDFCDSYYGGAAQVLMVSAKDTYYTGTDKVTLDEQLKNQSVGVCTGYTGQAYAEGDEDWGFAGIEGATVKIYENISLAIADLKNGAINAIIMDDTPAKEAASQNSADVKVIDVALTVEEYGIAVEKGNTELVEKINKALAELKEDGTYDDLLAKYELN